MGEPAPPPEIDPLGYSQRIVAFTPGERKNSGLLVVRAAK
jgi:hypothetical protein